MNDEVLWTRKKEVLLFKDVKKSKGDIKSGITFVVISATLMVAAIFPGKGFGQDLLLYSGFALVIIGSCPLLEGFAHKSVYDRYKKVYKDMASFKPVWVFTLTRTEILNQLPGNRFNAQKACKRSPFLLVDGDTIRCPLDKIASFDIHPWIGSYQVRINKTYRFDLKAAEVSSLIHALRALKISPINMKSYNPIKMLMLFAIITAFITYAIVDGLEVDAGTLIFICIFVASCAILFWELPHV